MTSDRLPPIFDKKALLERLMQDEELLREVLGRFLGSAPLLLDDLRQSIANRDLAQATFFSHRVKGTAATMSAEALKAVAWQMEQHGKAGRLEELAALLPELERQHRLMLEEMSQSLA